MNDANISTGESDLKPSEFEALLRRLDGDKDRAAEKYEDLRRKLIRFFEWNDCFPGDDLADKAFDRVARKLTAEQIHNVPAFLLAVARNMALDFHKRPPSMNLDELPPHLRGSTAHAESSVIEGKLHLRRLACLRKCLHRLSPSDRALFLAYEYYAGKGHNTRQLAEHLGISINAVQVRAHRVKQRLEKCTLKLFLSTEILQEDEKP